MSLVGVALLFMTLITSVGTAPVAAQDATPVSSDTGGTALEAGLENDAWTPVLVSSIDADTAPVRGTDGQYHVVYELVLTNTSSDEATLEGVTVLNAVEGGEIMRLTADELVSREIIRVLNRAPAENTTLPADSSRVLMLSVAFAAEGDVPAVISHQIDVVAMGSFSVEPEPFSYRAGIIDLSSFATPVVAPPLRGEGWIAAEGCCSPDSHHRNGLFPVNGSIYAGQRFAIDFIQVNADGWLVTGDPDVLENWEAYGKPVVAAAGGTVVDTYDGFEDQVPGVVPDMSKLSPMENTGNFVIVAHDDGTFSLYAHLKPGSVVVERGERVETGDTLAQVGNSGGSQAPHLHFGLTDRVPPAAAKGIPYAFDHFMVAGFADPAHLLEAIEGQASYPRDEGGPVAHENALPLSYVMVDFPE